MTDNTSKNIKALRNAYGETQLELAFAIGLDSPSAISQYENGTRTPQTRERQRLAEHFRITEDELAHGDYSDLDLKSFAVDDREKVFELFFKILPIIRTEEAMQDAQFRKGYEAHMCTYEDAKARKPVNESDALTSIEAYADSFYDNHICEAAANMLWWIAIEGVGVNCGTASEDVNKHFRNSLNMAEFLKSFFLKNCDDESDEEHRKAREEFREDLVGIDAELLKAMKESPHLSELADYYSAIMYRYIEPGESMNGVPCLINNLIDFDDMTLYEAMEPDVATIAFVGTDNKLHLVFYDFRSKTLTESNNAPVSIDEWSDSEISKLIPRVEAKAIIIDDDDDDWFSFEAYGVSYEYFEWYVSACKEAGFTANVDWDDSENYCAENADEYEVDIEYSSFWQAMSVSIDK